MEKDTKRGLDYSEQGVTEWGDIVYPGHTQGFPAWNPRCDIASGWHKVAPVAHRTVTSDSRPGGHSIPAYSGAIPLVTKWVQASETHPSHK